MIKTFRGLLADEDTNNIRLGTNNGLTGYKINKFQLIPEQPGAVTQESVVKIFTTVQKDATGAIETPDGVINFESPTLLAAGTYIISDNTGQIWNTSTIIVFDDKVFNQDIFITHKDVSSGQKVNYYLELEQIKLDINEATVATLKDMRGRE